MKNFGTGLLTLALAVLPARAQEPWDTSFSLLVGTVSGAEGARLGQDRCLGLSVQGAYPLTRKSFVLFDGGYRYLPTTKAFEGASTLEYKSDGFFASACYRHIFYDAFYAQAGVRGSQMRTMLREREGTYSLRNSKGPTNLAFAPVLGVGFRFNEKYGLELNASSVTLKGVDGGEKKATTLDVGLAIHFGK